MNQDKTSTIYASIIVPAFNAEKTLDKCLAAITAIDDFAKCELIVADDGSTDKTVEVTKKYSAKIVSASINKGAAFVRNLGAKAAQGEILLFIDSDIALLDKNILAHLKDDFRSQEICGVFGVYDEQTIYSNFFSIYKHLYMCLGQLAFSQFNATADSAILAVRRERYLEAGGFDETYPSATTEDVEFSIRVHLKENKLFFKDTKIKGVHWKKHGLRTLLRTNRLRIKGIAKLIQKKDYRKVYLKMAKSSSGKALFPMLLVVVSLALSFVYPVFVWGILVAILLFLLAQVGLWRYFRQRRGVIFAFSAIGFSFVEMFLAALFAFYYQIYFKLKR